MVKEATGSLDQASQVLAITNLTVLSGDDSLTLPLLSVGAEGVISVVGNIVPRDMIQLVAAFRAGNVDASATGAPAAVSAVSGHVGSGHESDSDQSCHETARTRHGRVATAHDAARCGRGSVLAQDARTFGLL